MHLTLAFMGNLERAAAADAGAAVEEAAGALSSFRAGLGRVGAFPDLRHPRVVWVGLEEGAAEVEHVATEIRSALSGRGIGFDPKPAIAHITIAQVRDRVGPADRRALGALIAALEPIREVDFMVEEAQLVQSTLTPRGPVYAVLRRVALR
jgi:2'-5' RNA ligase